MGPVTLQWPLVMMTILVMITFVMITRILYVALALTSLRISWQEYLIPWNTETSITPTMPMQQIQGFLSLWQIWICRIGQPLASSLTHYPLLFTVTMLKMWRHHSLHCMLPIHMTYKILFYRSQLAFHWKTVELIINWLFSRQQYFVWENIAKFRPSFSDRWYIPLITLTWLSTMEQHSSRWHGIIAVLVRRAISRSRHLKMLECYVGIFSGVLSKSVSHNRLFEQHSCFQAPSVRINPAVALRRLIVDDGPCLFFSLPFPWWSLQKSHCLLELLLDICQGNISLLRTFRLYECIC